MQNEIARAAAARRAQMEIDEEPEIEKHAPEPQETPEFVQAAEILASKRASAGSIPPPQDNPDAISEDGSYEKVYTTEEGGHDEGGGAYYNKKTDPDSRRHRHRKRHRTREIKPDTGEVERHCTCTIL